jgi:hypothetical protein
MEKDLVTFPACYLRALKVKYVDGDYYVSARVAKAVGDDYIKFAYRVDTGNDVVRALGKIGEHIEKDETKMRIEPRSKVRILEEVTHG